MSYSQSFLKAIRFTKGCDPFAFNFNEKLLENTCETSSDKLLTKEISWLYENVFLPTYNEAKRLANESNLTSEELVRYTIGLVNSQIHVEQCESHKLRNLTEIFNPISENDKVFDSMVDTLGFMISFFERLNLKSQNPKYSFSLSEIDVVADILRKGNICFEYRKNFQEVLWSGGEIQRKDGTIHFKIGKSEFLLAKEIGIKAFQNEVKLPISSHEHEFNKLIHGNRRIKENIYTADNLNFVSGKHITTRRRKCEDTIFYSDYISFYEPFFSYIGAQNYPDFNDLTILDCIDILNEIFLLFHSYQSPLIDLNKAPDLRLYTPRIRKKDFFEYLFKTLKFEQKTIQLFVEKCLVFDYLNLKSDLHISPLIGVGGYFYFTLTNLERTSLHLMIDYWNLVGGINNNEKGKAYENQLSKDFDNIFKQNKFDAEVIPVKSIEGYDGDIDLILRIQNTFLFCEVKSIKYPIDGRSFYKQVEYGNIKKASEQLNKLKAFLRETTTSLPKTFQKINSQNCSFVIVTNYPLYNGLSIEGYPIVSHSTLINYFKTDRMTLRLNSLTDSIPLKDFLYYSEKSKMGEQLNSYIRTPPFYTLLQQSNEIQEYKYQVSTELPDIQIQIYHFKNLLN